MHCASCGVEAKAGARFCERCGASLPRSCPNCSIEVPPTALFCHGCGTKLAALTNPGSSPFAPAAVPSPVSQARAASAAVEPELRQATILFCDLAGSTSLSTVLDPEDLRDVLRRYQAAAVSVISQHEGFVSAY